jgi:hypothetical protein
MESSSRGNSETTVVERIRLEVVMRKLLLVLFTAFCTMAVLSANAEAPRLIIGFHTMYGVDGPFVGTAHPIRDISGDDLPWEVTHFVRGGLTTEGHLSLVVRGLVFKDDPSVPPELRGKNDEANFRGAVSCLTESEETVRTVNVITAGFPATVTGNSDINAKIELPNPCVAPIVFVLAGEENKWFAVTGFEAEEEE